MAHKLVHPVEIHTTHDEPEHATCAADWGSGLALSLYGIAWLLAEQGHYDQAEAMQREALAMSRDGSGVETLGVARDLQGLGQYPFAGPEVR